MEKVEREGKEAEDPIQLFPHKQMPRSINAQGFIQL